MRVELIRHGVTALQRESRYQGRTDAPLSPEGAAALRPCGTLPDRVYVSPLIRARQTAAILFPGAEPIPVPALAEMDFGVFEGKNWKEMENNPDYRAWVEGGCLGRCPGGESRAEFTDRVCRGLTAILDACLAAGVGSLAAVAHGGTMMAALERFGRPARDYYDWLLTGGAGWLLDAGDWEKARVLKVLGETDHTEKGGAV